MDVDKALIDGEVAFAYSS